MYSSSGRLPLARASTAAGFLFVSLSVYVCRVPLGCHGRMRVIWVPSASRAGLRADRENNGFRSAARAYRCARGTFACIMVRFITAQSLLSNVVSYWHF